MIGNQRDILIYLSSTIRHASLLEYGTWSHRCSDVESRTEADHEWVLSTPVKSRVTWDCSDAERSSHLHYIVLNQVMPLLFNASRAGESFKLYESFDGCFFYLVFASSDVLLFLCDVI